MTRSASEIARFAALLTALLTALGACSATPPEPPLQRELRNVSSTGMDAFLRGDLRVAAASFERVLELGRLLDDAAEIGNAAFNLATVRLEAGDAAGARALAAEARAGLRRAGLPTADVALLEARIALVDGDRASVRTALTALADADETPTDTRVRALLALVELDAAAGSVESADASWRRAAELDDTAAPRMLEVRGQLELARADAAAAGATFDLAARGFAAREMPRAMAAVLERAAVAFADAGRLDDAADRWLRAAGARLALRDVDRAHDAATRAAGLAEALGDVELSGRAAALLDEMRWPGS